jgi:hypothetical protein
MAAAAALPFRHPFTGVCAGPTGSGKSELMKKIVLHARVLIDPPPDRIVWYYAEFQPKLNAELGGEAGVEFREGCPEMSEFSGSERVLIIIDDLMSECGKEITSLFVKGSHHRNLSIWLLVQNFYNQGNKEMRNITLNAQYVIAFKNPRDNQQIKVMARQMYDRDAQVLLDAFAIATREPHGYLLMDLKQSTPDHLRLRSKIIPGDWMEVYTSRRQFKGDRIELKRSYPTKRKTTAGAPLDVFTEPAKRMLLSAAGYTQV